MESRNKLAMCRLCLCENECLVNIFKLNGSQGFVAAEIISDFLQFQVSETDCYPHVMCSTCITKFTDFKLFKEFCLKSRKTCDGMLISSDNLVMHQPDAVSCGPILLKYEVLPFSRDSHRQEELIDSEGSENQGTVESTAELMPDPSQCLKLSQDFQYG